MWAHSKIEDDQTACVVCGCNNQNVLERHHIIPSRYGGTDTDKNLVTLCANCHTAIERIYNEDFWACVESLNLSEKGPEPQKHQENLWWAGDEEENTEYNDVDLEALSSQIISSGEVSKVETKRGDIDIDLLEFEFDVHRQDAKMLKKLIQREIKQSVDSNRITTEARNRLVAERAAEGVSQKALAEVFDISQPRVSQIVNESGNGEAVIDR